VAPLQLLAVRTQSEIKPIVSYGPKISIPFGIELARAFDGETFSNDLLIVLRDFENLCFKQMNLQVTFNQTLQPADIRGAPR
jgi:hypothetical protein